jgi:PIN domain nuclease of toxin-antitoxin system
VILLDTHAWLWWAASSPELPASLRRAIANRNEPVGVSAVSCLEVAWLVKKGRIVLPVSVEGFFADAIDGAGFELIALTPRIAALSAVLPDIHRDPIDRVLIATAIDVNAVLATKDATIATYPGVRIRWETQPRETARGRQR